MGNRHKKKQSPSLSPSKYSHYEKGKPGFIENTTIVSNRSASSTSYFNFLCINSENSRFPNENYSGYWKIAVMKLCEDFKTRNFWAGKMKKFIKKFKPKKNDSIYLDEISKIPLPGQIIIEKKKISSLENSLNFDSINQDVHSSSVTGKKSKSRKDEEFKKKIKKILSSTEILEEPFHDDLLKSELVKPIASNHSSMMMFESKRSNLSSNKNSERFQEEYKSRRFSFEVSEGSNKNSFFWGRHSLDNNKDKFVFKNNTFVLDYQAFLASLNNNNGENNEIKREEKYFYIKHYKDVTEIIETQLKSREHPIGYLLSCFCLFFEEEYENKMIFYDQSKKTSEKYLEIFQEVVSSIKDMVRLLQEAVFCYYDLKKFKIPSQSIFLFTKDNIINFMTSLIFDDEYIYDYLFTLQKDIDVFREINIKKSIDTMKNFSPSDFGICKRLCLNSETLAYFNNSIENNEIIKKKSDNFSFAYKKNQIAWQYHQPYSKAIKTIKMIEQCKSPLHKLKVVLKLAESIMKSIRVFYEDNGRIFTDNISGDEILVIFIYIITKANIPFLVSHCNFIEKFITNQLSFSISGYYLSTITAAINYIENKI